MDEPYISEVTYYRVHDEDGIIIFESEIEHNADAFLKEYLENIERSGDE